MYANALVSERGSAEKSSSGTGTILCVVTIRRKKNDPSCVQAKVIGMVIANLFLLFVFSRLGVRKGRLLPKLNKPPMFTASVV